MALLGKAPRPIVICSDDLQDGKWQDVLDSLNSLAAPPPFILASALIDCTIWAEALNVGAFDVVARPFEVEEVLHVVITAHLSTRRSALTASAANRKPLVASTMRTKVSFAGLDPVLSHR
jgi:FixJ family two-component response regulator